MTNRAPIFCLLAFGLLSWHQVFAEETTDKVTDTQQAKPPKDNRCRVIPDQSEWVDRIRTQTHIRLCNTASWLDGLFGDEIPFDGRKFTGKVALGLRQDEVDGLDPRFRVRIKTKLPNVSKRFNAFIGRVEEDSYISNTEVEQDRLNSVGLRSTNDDDSEWLIGLGYRDPSKSQTGWDYSVGAKLSGGFAPYAKTAYRHLYRPNENSFWKTTQTLFWRKKDGFGASSNADYTILLDDNDIWVNHASIKYTEEAEQVEWFTETTWHHSFSRKRGISSSLYARGEAENEVAIPEFGVTFKYVKPILRDWLYLETGLDWRWERQYKSQTNYKSAISFGVQLEMLLGDYYSHYRGK